MAIASTIYVGPPRRRARSAAPSRAKLKKFVESVARLDTDSDIQERSDGDDCMESDDAVATLGRLIDEARRLVTSPNHKPE